MSSIAKTVDTLVQSFQTYRDENEQKFADLETNIETETKKQELINKPPVERSIRATTEGEFTMTLSQERDYKNAFQSYVKCGEEQALRTLERKSLSTMVNADGGYSVPQTLVAKLEEDLSDVSVIRRLSNVMQVSSSSVDLLLNATGAAVGWAGEQDERGETDTPHMQKLVVPVHEMYAKPRATQKLLDDASINIEQWLSESVSHRLAEVENHAFLYGDGDKKPTGILTYPMAEDSEWGTFSKVSFDENNIIDNLVDMFAGIEGQYLSNAVWMMSRSTLAHIRKVKDQDGRHIWQPSLDATSPSMLLGYPVELCDDMPTLGTEEAASIIFGNFERAYQVVDRQGINVLRDPYSSKPYIEFYTTKRVGGDVINFDALIMLK